MCDFLSTQEMSLVGIWICHEGHSCRQGNIPFSRSMLHMLSREVAIHDECPNELIPAFKYHMNLTPHHSLEGPHMAHILSSSPLEDSGQAVGRLDRILPYPHLEGIPLADVQGLGPSYS